MTLLVIALSGLPWLSPSGHAEDAFLKWRNGDSLKGDLLTSSDKIINWKAPPFAAPLSIQVEQLEGIRLPRQSKTKQAPPPAPFRLLLKNGDRLEGELEFIDEKAIGFLAVPFQETARIPKAHVERLIHVGSDYLRYSGPSDLDSWTSSGRDRKISEWHTDLTGAFATHQWSGNLFREIEFPKAVEIHFQAAFPLGSPNLEIGLVRGADLGPKIETWDNFLVLTYRSQFVPVMELGEETKRLDFRFLWDQTTGKLLLCDPSGRKLASIDRALVDRRASDSTKSRASDPLIRGFSILNHTPELKLLSLSVQEWNGKDPAVINLAKPRLLMAGREPQFATDRVRLSAGSNSIRTGSGSYPIEELQEFILGVKDSVDPTPEKESNSRIAWHDGSSISGRLTRLEEGSVAIETDWSPGELQLNLNNAKEIRFPNEEIAPIAGTDQLEGEGYGLRGAVRPLAQKQGQSLTGWLSPGATHPVPFSDTTSAKVTRYPHASANPDLTSLIGQTRVYLKNDEILVGSLISIEHEAIEFSSKVTGPINIPTSNVRAVDIGSSGRLLEGFADLEWEEIEDHEDDVSLTRDTAIIRAGGFGNPSLVLGDRIHFSAKWKQTYGAVTLKLFANGFEENSPSTDIIIAAQGNRLFVGKLKESGAFSFSGDQIPMVGDIAEFEIRMEGDNIEVIVNGKTSIDIVIEEGRVSGNGIYFKMGGGWQGWNQSDNEITISDFRIERSPGSIPRRVIDPSAKEMSLALPRSRRSPAPRHLLIAPNGDLLRGQLNSATAKGVNFRVNETTIDLPTERISAIVWLNAAVSAEEEAEEVSGADQAGEEDLTAPLTVTHEFVLMDGSRLNLHADEVVNEKFVGESSLLGTCTIAIDNIREMKRGPARSASELESFEIGAFKDWTLKPTPDPVIPGTESNSPSPLVGKEAPSLELTMLDGSIFKLAEHRGKVVVLDFWATWCGPCIKAMPDIQQVVAAMPEGAVTLCSINQAESPPIISQFLESRKWTDLPVTLDFDMKVSRAYLVEEIPHTVVVGKDGKVHWVHEGYSEDLQEKLFNAIAESLQQ
ncbi:MAG: TlpA disulfide reductase family protein [Verrucomicrobiales bacterium]|nr:TlpA disulfide reductase family protein [Verrucomicrobiales bacterium]